jgi:hypothetical protein
MTIVLQEEQRSGDMGTPLEDIETHVMMETEMKVTHTKKYQGLLVSARS